MIAFAWGIVQPAIDAGIKVPDSLAEYNPSDFPYWHVYCTMQLGAPMPYAGCHWENAHIIAKIPIDRIKTVNYDDVVEMGFSVGYSK